ncbi:uncharacterized protein LOC115632770 [Scaptodrosophila lebanonensis]|uniref:MORN repeat-containing protein 5 n=1 Tax=Drosophila lebanonensis TaxID=7225 RepID=A0A6J2UEP1_DROLE|nr:uncharacterized protein LOC115632770 [Scaptodrosophila lebanonensis]
MITLHPWSQTSVIGSTIGSRSILMTPTSSTFFRRSPVDKGAQHRFLTRSSYEGSWNKKVHTMDGFGTYRFPDGSEYRGYFHRGKFHGYGQLKLAAPYRFSIKGEFVEGKLKNVADMWFEDGLHLDGTFENGYLNCKDWKYLSDYDRRFHGELSYGQQPVGPTSYFTGKSTSRHLKNGTYDAEEGIFHPKTGYITNRVPPFTRNFYVTCHEDRDWITRHCRRGVSASENAKEPLPRFCRQIISNNLDDEKRMMGKKSVCLPAKGFINRKQYFHKICDELNDEDAPKSVEESMERSIGVDSSCDIQSITEQSFKEGRQNFGRIVRRVGPQDINVRVVQSNLTLGFTSFLYPKSSAFDL